MSYIFDLFFVFISITINDYNSHSCFFGTFLSQVSACVLYKSVAYQKTCNKAGVQLHAKVISNIYYSDRNQSSSNNNNNDSKNTYNNSMEKLMSM